MQPERVTGERRPVTALFADVVGSTSLAERMDAEDWAMTMEGAMAIMAGAVERYDGWVASHTGDGLMAIFGLPTAHEDDPARAVSSAIEMVAAIDEFGQKLRADDIEFRIRVGVNSGEVVVRETGAGGATRDSRIYGDTLNVAARMQSEAEPGGIMITGETFGYIGGIVESRHVGRVSVKGKAEPVEAYEVIGRTGVLRTIRGIAGLTSPMVGRDGELEKLTATLAPVHAGLGRMAVVVGEPGIGKSRLLRELRSLAMEDGCAWVEARTVSYGRKLPLHLAVDLVRALVGLPDPLESIPADAAGEQLKSRVGELMGPDAAVTGPLLAHLLSLPLDEHDRERVAHMEPQTLKLRYVEAISALIAATARQRPLVMVCDDVHWADDASVDLLRPLASAVSGHPVLWVVVSRREREAPGWRLVGAAEEAFGDALVDLRLAPLESEDGERLVANLLEIDSLPMSTRTTILRRAEGNPLFVEEIIRMLIDGGAIELVDGRWVATAKALDVEIPETLHGLLLARIDRLPDEARRVLRIASVIGRTFAVRVLDHVAGRPDSANPGRGIGGELALLEGAGLITLAAASPEPEYTFRHALIGDAAYASLLKQERRSLHHEVAETLLALYPDREADMAAVLAHHFERADDRERALEYLAIAARGARSRFARHEAVEFAALALALLPEQDADASDRRLRAELRLLQAAAGIDFVPSTESFALLEAVIADAEALEDPATAARAYLLIGAARALSGEQYHTSPPLELALTRATELAEESGSPGLVALAMMRTGQSRFTASEFTAAIELFEQAIPALIDTEQFYAASVAAGQLGIAYGHVGEYQQAVAWTDRGSELGLTSGDPNATLDADLARSIVEGIRGDTVVSIEYGTKAASAAARVDNKACALVAHSVIGEQHLRDGDTDRAAISFETSADLATFCQFMPVKIQQTELLLQTARARSGVGSVEFERYQRALDLAREIGDRLAEAQLFEQRASDRIAAGQGELAGEDLSSAATLYEELGAIADVQRIREVEAALPTTTTG